jgi:hypothetical protein
MNSVAHTPRLRHEEKDRNHRSAWEREFTAICVTVLFPCMHAMQRAANQRCILCCDSTRAPLASLPGSSDGIRGQNLLTSRGKHRVENAHDDGVIQDTLERIRVGGNAMHGCQHSRLAP